MTVNGSRSSYTTGRRVDYDRLLHSEDQKLHRKEFRPDAYAYSAVFEYGPLVPMSDWERGFLSNAKANSRMASRPVTSFKPPGAIGNKTSGLGPTRGVYYIAGVHDWDDVWRTWYEHHQDAAGHLSAWALFCKVAKAGPPGLKDAAAKYLKPLHGWQAGDTPPEEPIDTSIHANDATPEPCPLGCGTDVRVLAHHLPECPER